MPPRLSARRLCLVIAFFGGVTLLFTWHDRLWTLTKPKILTIRNNLMGQRDEQRLNDVTTPRFDIRLKKGDEEEELDENNNVLNEINNRELEENEMATESSKPKEKPWYMRGGTLFPTNAQGPAHLFPNEEDSDRILEQLMYVPEDYQGDDSPEKVILAYNGLGTWGQKGGSASFHGCPVSRCSLTDDRGKSTEADAILYKDHFIYPGVTRPMNQVWIMYFLECPYHTQSIKFPDVINWTATYRRDSDLVAPYERWTYHDPNVKQLVQNRDYSANKTKKVAWFVSNCGARNGRLAYARELSKYISVDIYGSCGPLKCPRTDRKCFEILDKEYKFYLAFENSNCRDYITEKFYVNGLSQNVLPIVMGGRPEDYQRSAPEGSYIHVDEFANPAELAAYLHRLDKDTALYNSYFKWKGTGEFINTYFWCRLCAMLHAPRGRRHYENVNDWWRGPGVCSSKSWRSSASAAGGFGNVNNGDVS